MMRAALFLATMLLICQTAQAKPRLRRDKLPERPRSAVLLPEAARELREARDRAAEQRYRSMRPAVSPSPTAEQDEEDPAETTPTPPPAPLKPAPMALTPTVVPAQPAMRKVAPIGSQEARPQWPIGSCLTRRQGSTPGEFWLLAFNPKTREHTFVKRERRINVRGWDVELLTASPDTRNFPGLNLQYVTYRLCLNCAGRGWLLERAQPLRWGFVEVNAGAGAPSLTGTARERPG